MTLIYIPRSQLYIADMLSRAPEPHTLLKTDNLEGPYTAVYAMSALPQTKHDEYKRATAQDTILQQLANFILTGWPRTLKQLGPELRPYWPHQDELHLQDDLIYRGSALVVPRALQQAAIHTIHGSHQGIHSCEAKAKIHFFWPRMADDITSFIQACTICSNRSRANPAMPMIPHPVPELPSALGDSRR